MTLDPLADLYAKAPTKRLRADADASQAPMKRPCADAPADASPEHTKEPMQDMESSPNLFMKVDFFSLFLDSTGGFLDLADAKAAKAANAAMRCGQPSCSGSNAQTATSQEKVKTSKNRKQVSGEKTWWQALGQQQSPLRSYYLQDQKKGLKMDAKRFASRVYHKVDSLCSRSLAQSAHRDALKFLSEL